MGKCRREQESEEKKWREYSRERLGYFNKFNNYFNQE